MKRAPIYPVLIVSLVIGFLLGTLSTSTPALGIGGAGAVSGGTVTSCVGVTNSSTGLNLGGRTITPSTILRVPNNQPCAPAETTLNLNSYANTVLVSAASPVSATNGTNLLNALNSITTASATNPYLLKLEPGIYFLGNAALQMKPFVDIEGSGEGVTTISSGVTTNLTDNATILAADNTEVRFLSIVNTNTNDNTEGIALANLTGSKIRLTNLTLSTPPNLNNYGILQRNNNNATLALFNIKVTSRQAITLYNGNVTLMSSQLNAPSGIINLGDGVATIQNSIINSNNNGTAAMGNNPASVKIATSQVIGFVQAGGNIVCFQIYDANLASKTC